MSRTGELQARRRAVFALGATALSLGVLAACTKKSSIYLQPGRPGTPDADKPEPAPKPTAQPQPQPKGA